MIPQILYLILLGLGLGIALVEHGKEKTGKHNFWVSFSAAFIGVIILYYGGFFDPLFN